MDKKIISFEIPVSLDESLRVEAFNRNVTKSALIRDILEEVLNKEPKDSAIRRQINHDR